MAEYDGETSASARSMGVAVAIGAGVGAAIFAASGDPFWIVAGAGATAGSWMLFTGLRKRLSK